MSTNLDKDGDKVPEEIANLLQHHQEVIVITVDPVADSKEAAVNAFAKMLDKDKGGKLASLLESILSNLKATYGEKCGRVSGKATVNT